MIRPIDIRLNAAHPDYPLAEAVTFTGSPSTVLIRGVPPNCGRWAITAVSVAATYPDGSTTTRAAVQSANGVWVATLPATATSGRTANGLRVMADGIDETGEAVTGYVLGVADFAVASLDVTPAPQPGETSWQMLYFDAVPGTLRKGDVAKIDGVLKLYNGTAWEEFATPPTLDDAVTRDSTNGVKSSGIWSAIWGTLSALPTGFSSLYDWCVNKLSGKVNTSNGLANQLRLLIAATSGSSAGVYALRVKYDEATFHNRARLEIVKQPAGPSASEVIVASIDLPASDGTLALLQNIAPNFSTSATYALDALCVYGGVLYRCTTAVTTAGAWTGSTNWTAATVDDALAVIRAAIPSPSTSTPQMDGTGSAGSSASFARGDHVHPSDSTKLDKSGPNNRKIQWNAESGFLEVVGSDSGHLIFPNNLYGSAEFAASREYVDDKDSKKLDASSASAPFSLDSSVSYPVGSHCTYQGKLYKCTTATTGGIWVAGSWTADTMTNSLHYDRITITTGQLQDHAEQKVTLNAATTTLSLPALTDLTGKVSDFGIDVVNGYEVSGTPTAASFTLAGTIGTDYNIIVPEGEDWSEMSALAAGEMAQFYFTLSSFQLDSKPTWKVVKQVVQKVTIPTVTP